MYVNTDYTEKLYLHMENIKRESLRIYFVVHTLSVDYFYPRIPLYQICNLYTP